VRTALDIVRDLVREEQTLAQRLEVVRAQLGALKRLAAGPARTAAPARRSRPSGKKHARARRAPRRPRVARAPLAEERPVKIGEAVARLRGKAIREVLEHARMQEATASAELALEPAASPKPVKPRRARRAEKLEVGATFGCWTVLREIAPDSYGRARYWAKASCCGREATKGRGDLEQGREACKKCLVRTKVAPDLAATPTAPRRRGPNACGACGEKGHHTGTCAERAAASPWVRCKLAVPVTTGAANIQAQGYTACGALVLGKKRHQHLVDVHGLEVAVDELGQHFEAVDPRQGAER